MTTDTKPDNTTENTENSNPEIEDQAAKNKAVFGPLGKYAVIAVIMVSIIVTGAIMLNKQLGSSEEMIASIEEEVSEMASADADTTASVSESTAAVVVAETSDGDAIAIAAETTAVSVPSAAIAETQETVVVAQTADDTAISASSATTENDPFTARLDARQAQLAAQFQARIEAHKLEQKQHMTDMFARIKEQEAQQLNQYKSSQDAQVERLREQIAKQQQMIDTLISRNKELYELRAANVQQHQTRREEIINRI